MCHMAILDTTGYEPAHIEQADRALDQLVTSPQGWENPFPLYRQMREAAPLYRSGHDGLWYATGFETVRTVLNHTSIGKNPMFAIPRHGTTPGRIEIARRRPRRSMITSDPPEHTRLRGVAKGAFIPPRMEALRSRIAEIVDERLDRLAEFGEADLMTEVAFQMPVTVIGELIGIPKADRDWFWPVMKTLVGGDNGRNTKEELDRVAQAGDELDAYFNDLIADRAAHPDDDMLSELIARRDAGEIDHEELRATVSLLFVAGFITTTNLVGNGTKALLDHPGEMARLWADPELVPPRVEEALRFDSPVPLVHRLVTEPCEVDGQELRPGEMVICLLAAANHDPARFDDPERFDITRPDNNHVAFAWGLHFCLGARLARMEAQLMFAGMRERFATIEPAGPHEYRIGFAFRGLDHLPIRVTPR